MNRILKYKVDAQLETALLPLNSNILRVAHVDDGFYNGDFIWAIVNSDNIKYDLCEINLRTTIYNGPPIFTLRPWIEDLYSTFNIKDVKNIDRIQLAVKEKQEICISGIPYGAGEDDGKIYLYYTPSSLIKTFKIAVFKTGQNIDIPVENLQYLGLNRLWIIQELGLYTFLVRE